MTPPATPPVLRTERLVLRQWREQDRDPFAALNADPRVMEFFPACPTRAESDALIDRHRALLAAGEPGLFAVEVAATGTFIGFVGLAVPRFEAAFTPCVEIGWRLARDAWGHGYASEAARTVLTHAFEDLGLPEVVSFTAAVNLRSRAVMERIGLTRDPADDFDHPLLAPDSPLLRHVLYRGRRSAQP
ncbi:GNAT family N-acetyltransferase [Marmoricola sp. RAF53]|uniref:GNAT family N-acetyltransferase n=1 Tax=Marmoricola sp. RAF53 TaxID=3233059 RepID=UPI003F96BD1A